MENRPKKYKTKEVEKIMYNFLKVGISHSDFKQVLVKNGLSGNSIYNILISFDMDKSYPKIYEYDSDDKRETIYRFVE